MGLPVRYYYYYFNIVGITSFLHYSAGEDGQIKIWSKSGMLRSTLASQGEASLSILHIICVLKVNY